MKFRVMSRVFLILIPVLTVLTSISSLEIAGDSMNPLIKNGDTVYSIPVTRYNQGEIVIAKINGKLVIKRLYGKPGDIVEVKENKIMINNMLVKNLDYQMEDFNKTLEKGEYFLVGDNPNTEVILTTNLLGRVEKVISNEGN